LRNKYHIVLPLVFISLFFVVTHWISLPQIVLLWITDIAWTFASGFIAWKCWQLSTSLSGIEKQTWRIFAYANFSWFVGILIWDYLELVAHIVTPFPAISDLFFMLFALLFNVALVRMRVGDENASFTVIQISKLGIIISSIVIAHIFLFSELVSVSSENTLYIVASVAYSVLYVSAFLYALMFFLHDSLVSQRRVLIFVIGSIVLHSVATEIYSYSLLGGTYAVGDYIDVIWLLAFASMYIAVIEKTKIEVSNQPKNITLEKESLHWISVVAMPAAILALLIMCVIYIDNLNKDNSIYILFFAAILLVSFAIKEIAEDARDKALKSAAKTSEENFQVISGAVPGVVYKFRINDEGERSFPYVSPTISNLVGLDPAAVMKDASLWINHIHPDDMSDFELSVEKSLNTLTPWKWEGRMAHADGNVYWYRGESIPVRETGCVTWTGIVINITDEKLAEADIAESRARFEAMFESIPDAVVYADPDRKIQMVNTAAIQMFGYDEEELRGNETKMLYASEEMFLKQGARRFNANNNSDFMPDEVVYRCKNGQEFIGETLPSVVRSSDGEVQGYLGIIRDVSERELVQNILRALASGEQGQQFESFLHIILERLTQLYACKYAFIGMLHDDGTHVKTLAVRANGKVTDNFEYELKGMPCEELVDQYKTIIFRNIRQLYPDNKLVSDMNVDSCFGAPLISSDGSIIGILAVMDSAPLKIDALTEPVLDVFATRVALELERDIATKELQHHKENLQELVDEQTVDLVVARDEAQKASAAKSDFLSRMSHELRTPLNAILGFSQVLKLDAETLNEVQRQNVQEILDAGAHLLTLINEVLDLAKIESGQNDVSMEEVDIDNVLQQSLKIIQAQANARKVNIIDKVSSKGYIVRADDTRLKQVFINLLSNAVKYNCKEGRIVLASEIITNDRLRISISDTGNGLTEDELSKLFIPFERLNKVDNIEGTGIGLVTTKYLIELMGGVIGVRCVPDEGCTFWFELELVSPIAV